MPDRRRERIWIGVAVAVLLGLLLMMVPDRRVPMDQRLTTLRTSPDGAGALYALLTELDIPVDRRMTPLDGSTPLGGALALLNPTEPLGTAELDSLVAWVQRGGTLIAAPGWGDPLLRRMAVERRYIDPDSARWGRPVAGRLTEGVDSVGAVVSALVVDESTALANVQPLVVTGTPGHAILLRAHLGRGTVILVSDPTILSNQRIAESGAAVIIARLAAEAARPGRPLVFDEYHHGHRGGSPTEAFVGFLAGDRMGWLILQLLVVAALAMLPAAVRFGAPVAAGTPERRSPLEHVAALGEVYRQARAVELAHRRLVVGFARRLGRERPAPGGEAAFLARVGRGAPAGVADAVAAVSQAWERRLPVRELAERIDEALNRLNRTG